MTSGTLVPERERARLHEAARTNGDGTGPQAGLLLRVVTAAGLVLAAVYGLACLIYNMPNSPVKVRAIGAANKVMLPWFEQDWQLFAPTPATTNDHLLVTVRLREPNGEEAVTKPRDIETPIEDLPRSDHVLPTKQPGITLAMQELFGTYRTELKVINANPAVSSRGRLHQRLNRQFAPNFNKLDRLLSYEATWDFPGKKILQVRATFTQTPIVPFSERTVTHPPAIPATSLLRTSWMPYVPDVGK